MAVTPWVGTGRAKGVSEMGAQGSLGMDVPVWFVWVSPAFRPRGYQ